MFWSKILFFLSVDDKARVPIGVTVANKKAALVIHVSHEIQLLEHSFAKSTKH